MVSRKRAIIILLLYCCFLATPNTLPHSALAKAATSPLIQEFPAPTKIATPPLKIIVGSNGDLWFNQFQTNTLTRFTLNDKHFHTYHTLSAFNFLHSFTIDKNDHPWLIAKTTPFGQPPYYNGGPSIIGQLSPNTGNIVRYQPITSDIPYEVEIAGDATVWYVTDSLFGHITRNGAVVEFAKSDFVKRGEVRSLIPGPGGDMWFTVRSGAIGKVTPQGHVTEYALMLPSREYLTSMVRGADGNFWFLDPKGNKIGRITPQGISTIYTIPAQYNVSNWSNMMSGSDGNLWFTDTHSNQLISMTLQQSVTAYTMPEHLLSITSSSDGAIWFTESAINKIFRFLPPARNAQTGNPQLQLFQEFVVPQQSSAPLIILPGPAGDIWFSEAQTSSIGRITTQGVLLPHYTTPQAYKYLGTLTDLARGKDGNLWFPYEFGSNIARITPQGQITTFTSPDDHTYSSFSSNGDGNVWFLAGPYNFGYVTPQGKIKEFGFPYNTSAYNGNATHLTAGPDGNIWITETSKNKIGRLTRSGNITEYPIPSAPSVSTSYPLLPMPPSSQPTLITGGSDGNIWFLETNGNKLGRITPQGHITEFPLKEHLADVRGMSFASDGNLWLTDVNQLIRVTPSSGIESTYQIAPDSYLEGITSGPDGNLWFADGGAGKIGRLQLSQTEPMKKEHTYVQK